MTRVLCPDPDDVRDIFATHCTGCGAGSEPSRRGLERACRIVVDVELPEPLVDDCRQTERALARRSSAPLSNSYVASDLSPDFPPLGELPGNLLRLGQCLPKA